MSKRVQEVIDSITAERRAGYLWPTKQAAAAVGLHPNKFSQWWNPNREKLIALCMAYPAESAAELLKIVAEAQSRLEQDTPARDKR